MRSAWKQDIEQWALDNTRDPNKVEAICLRKGWNPERYSSSMQNQLFDWLDSWYTLSIKKMATPATQLRRNPLEICPECELEITFVERLPNGKMLGSCGDVFHDLDCSCYLCSN